MAMTNNNDFSYTPLSETEVQRIWNKHRIIIGDFIKNNGYDAGNIYINENSVMAVIAKVDQRKKYFEYFHRLNMSECKEVALMAFWYIKLQPICASSKEVNEEDLQEIDAINEKLAVHLILLTLKKILKSQNMSVNRLNELSKTYLGELIYSFRYRDFSKESMILLVETMAVFLGIDPYRESVRN